MSARAIPPVPAGKRLLAVAGLAAGALALSLVALADEFADRGATLDQLLPPEEARAMEQASAALARQAEVVLVALAGKDARWSDERVASLTEALAALPGIARADELEPPGTERRLVAPDVRVLAAILSAATRPLEEERALARRLEELLAAAQHAGERAYAIGWPRLRADSWALARLDLARALPVLAVLALAVPPVFLGSLGAGLFALLVAASTTALTLWSYRLACGPLSPLVLLIVPLLWAVATMDALHLAGRVRALAARGLDASACLQRARSELWAPCLVTTLTSASGLGVMGLAGRAGLLKELGLLAAAGVLAAYLVTFGPCAPVLRLCARVGPPPRWPTALGLGLMRRARARPARWIGAWTLLALGALAALPGLAVSTAFPRLFAARVPLARDLEHLAGALGTDLCPLEVVVAAADEAGQRPMALLSAVVALTHELRSLPEVRAVLPLDLLATAQLGSLEPNASPDEREAQLAQWLAREELAPWVDPARGAARLQVHFAPTSFARKSALLARVRHFDATMLGHHALHLGGPGYGAHRAEELGLLDLRSGTLLSVLALAVVLALALRRPRAVAATLAVGALPLLVVAGVMGLADIPWSLALLPLPTVLLGVAMDDSVHLLYRPRGRERFDALPAILATTALVTSCVATLAGSSLESNRWFGLLLALGLLVALAADLTLLPALVRSRGRDPDARPRLPGRTVLRA